jgi:hypothetical protein
MVIAPPQHVAEYADNALAATVRHREQAGLSELNTWLAFTS